MDVRELEIESERRAAVPVLRQLWNGKVPEDVLAWTGEDDYHCFGGYVAGDLVGVVGVLVAGALHHARHAWLYDLVVDEPRRGEGHGRALVRVETWAREEDCDYLALASPLDRDETHAFYETLEYERWRYVIERDLRDRSE